MTSYLFVLVLYSGTLLQVTDAVNCKRYYNAFGQMEGPNVCDFGQSCCGTCKVRLCCPFPSLLELVSSDIINLSEDVQNACPNNYSVMLDADGFLMLLVVAVIIIGVIFISLVVFCCVCPCCCLYEMCRKPRPVVTHTTVVVSNPVPPQAPRPAPAQQCPGYQPVPMQPWPGAPASNGEHPVPSAPMLEDAYGLGPPPPYTASAVTGGPVNYNQKAYC